MFQTVFKRVELKYLLSKKQKTELMSLISEHMIPDCYGCSLIRNLYYDSDNYRLIRRSIEKPVYKEKLRIRGYGQVNDDSLVFVELKKKYKKVVYKRRLCLPEKQAVAWLNGDISCPVSSQIANEIDYVLHHYQTMQPVVFLTYQRSAFFGKQDNNFRVTFDQHILCRLDELFLTKEISGSPLIDDDQVLMEIKCVGAMPLWMAHFLSENQLFQVSFSKYGTAYQKLILPRLNREGILHV